MRVRVIVVAGLLLLGAASAAFAQDAPPGRAIRPSPVPSSGGPDFLFGQPHAWVSLSGAWVFPRAGGDLFAFFNDQLTLDRSDFRSRAVAADLGVAITSRLDVVAGIEVNHRQVASEYRRFVSSTAQPIQQDTRLGQANVAVGLRYAPLGRGRRVSRFAFVPRKVTPYVGAGLNVGFYRLTQSGQFVDYVDLSIFNQYFNSAGSGTGSYLQAGADIQIWRRLFLAVHGKYTRLHSGLDADFVGFDGIDLSGFRGATGVSVVF